jgi:FKBP-type peptidyl-prolyl cis-trans isomerase
MLLRASVFPPSRAGRSPHARGSKWKLYVPPQLGYGEQGLKAKSGKTVPPNAALIFELELLGVRQAEPGGRNVASGVLRSRTDDKARR